MNGPSDASATALPLGSVLDFLRLVWAIDQGLQRTSKRMEKVVGVTGPQRFVLRLVGRFPGLTVGRLAEVMRIHPSTVSGILKRLEKRGLVHRRLDTRDRRRAFLGLTAKGRLLDIDAAGTVEDAVRQALAGISPRRLEHARAVLEALAESLMDTPAPPAASAARRATPSTSAVKHGNP
jgi:DNA-binding MarR family transcriptional regulator